MKFIGSFAVLLLLLLSVFASLPQTKASSIIEKFPTTTSVIVAGWNNPTNVYISGDGNFAESTTNNAQQEYGGFSFSFNATDTIERVYVRIKSEAGIYLVAPTMEGEYNGIIRAYDAGIWRSYTVVNLYATTLSGLDDATLIEPLITTVQAFDITNYINTPSDLNNLSLRMRSYLISGDGFYWDVEAISVEVSYTTTESEENFITGLFAGSVVFGAIGLILALVAKRRS